MIDLLVIYLILEALWHFVYRGILNPPDESFWDDIEP